MNLRPHLLSYAALRLRIALAAETPEEIQAATDLPRDVVAQLAGDDNNPSRERIRAALARQMETAR